MEINLTQHARARMQQRAISAELLEILLEFGEIKFNGRGTEIVTFPKRAIKKLKTELPHHSFVSLEKHLNVYAVLSKDDALITVGHRTKHLKMH